jgi:hypothetical protein
MLTSDFVLIFYFYLLRHIFGIEEVENTKMKLSLSLLLGYPLSLLIGAGDLLFAGATRH